ncbi:hypothetical protein BH11BAC2_BH11BAC2_21860 [soil metagenome]
MLEYNNLAKSIFAHMKTLLVLLLSICSLNLSAQKKVEEYTATNGITYRVGDNIQIGVGSGTDGDFRYIKFTSEVLVNAISAIAGETMDPHLQANSNGKICLIKKVRSYKDKIYLLIDAGEEMLYQVDIEKAIRECEVAYCLKDAALTQEQFEKLILTQQYFEEGKITKGRFTELRNEIIMSLPQDDSDTPEVEPENKQ